MLNAVQYKMIKFNYGFAVFSYRQVLDKYAAFVQTWIRERRPEVFIVSLDLEKCYDNIDAETCLKFLEQSSLASKNYKVLQYFTFKSKHTTGKESGKKVAFRDTFKYSYRKMALDVYDPVKKNAPALSGSNLLTITKIFKSQMPIHRCIITEPYERRDLFVSTILKMLRQVIVSHNYVQLDKHFYRQLKGIPQGLRVSGFLASFYHAVIEQKHIKPVLQKSDPKDPYNLTLLMRMVDDYLLITTSRSKAINFLMTMKQLSS